MKQLSRGRAQELPGPRGVEMMMINSHLLNKVRQGIRSPLDGPA
jgi:hypothetical protein